MAAVAGVYGDQLGGTGEVSGPTANGRAADIFSLADAADSTLTGTMSGVSGLSDDEDYLPRATLGNGDAGDAANGKAHVGSSESEQRLRQQVAQLKREKAALESRLRAAPAITATELAEMQKQPVELRKQLEASNQKAEALQRALDKMQASLDRSDTYLQRLAAEMEGVLTSAAAGNTDELQAKSRTLGELMDQRRALEAAETFKFTREEVEGLRSKLRALHEKLQVNPSSRVVVRPKERDHKTFNDFIESLVEAQAEVDHLRDENVSTMKQLVMKKVELAETQEEVTKTKRALIRAVNKQMTLAYKLDEVKTAYADVMSRQGSRLTRGFSRKNTHSMDGQ